MAFHYFDIKFSFSEFVSMNFLIFCLCAVWLSSLRFCTHLSEHFTLAYTTLLRCVCVSVCAFFALFRSLLIFDHIRTYLHLLTLSRKCLNKHYFTHSFCMHFFSLSSFFFLLCSLFCPLILFRTVVTSSKLLSIVFFLSEKRIAEKKSDFLTSERVGKKTAQNKEKNLLTQESGR